MSFINENLQILATLGSALAVYIFIRIGARKETAQISLEIKEIKKDVQSLDSRIARIEGHLTGMHYHWEPKIIHKKEEQ